MKNQNDSLIYVFQIVAFQEVPVVALAHRAKVCADKVLQKAFQLICVVLRVKSSM